MMRMEKLLNNKNTILSSDGFNKYGIFIKVKDDKCYVNYLNDNFYLVGVLSDQHVKDGLYAIDITGFSFRGKIFFPLGFISEFHFNFDGETLGIYKPNCNVNIKGEPDLGLYTKLKDKEVKRINMLCKSLMVKKKKISSVYVTLSQKTNTFLAIKDIEDNVQIGKKEKNSISVNLDIIQRVFSVLTYDSIKNIDMYYNEENVIVHNRFNDVYAVVKSLKTKSKR